MNDIEELKRQGLSIQAISKLTGFDRKTARKYLLQPEGTPVYGPRPARPSKLDAFKAYIEERLKAACGTRRCCFGNCALAGSPAATRFLKDWLHPSAAPRRM